MFERITSYVCISKHIRYVVALLFPFSKQENSNKQNNPVPLKVSKTKSLLII